MGEEVIRCFAVTAGPDVFETNTADMIMAKAWKQVSHWHWLTFAMNLLGVASAFTLTANDGNHTGQTTSLVVLWIVWLFRSASELLDVLFPLPAVVQSRCCWCTLEVPFRS